MAGSETVGDPVTSQLGVEVDDDGVISVFLENHVGDDPEGSIVQEGEDSVPEQVRTTAETKTSQGV